LAAFVHFQIINPVVGQIADKWSPALQIRTVLLSVQALLSAPNPDDPLANDVAEHYKKDEKGYVLERHQETIQGSMLTPIFMYLHPERLRSVDSGRNSTQNKAMDHQYAFSLMLSAARTRIVH
jgi:hypothetical protein